MKFLALAGQLCIRTPLIKLWILIHYNHILDIARRMLWFFNENIQSNWVWFQYFSYNWSKNICFTLKSIFLNFCYFLITPNYSQCFDSKSEFSELYKTEHFLKNHKTTSVRVYQSYALNNHQTCQKPRSTIP